jgi:hypothetical protein
MYVFISLAVVVYMIESIIDVDVLALLYYNRFILGKT